MRRLLLLCTSLLVLLVPATAQAAYVDLGDPGAKLTHAIVGDTLRCQALYTGDARGEFFGGATNGSDEANCGTSLSVDGTLYGFPGGSNFTPTTQDAPSGAGTKAAPRTTQTRVAAGSTGVGIEQTDSYVYGDEAIQTDIRIINGNDTPKTVRVYRAGDCFLQNSDRGFGFMNAQTGAIGCSATANNEPAGRVLGFLPLTSGSYRFEGNYGDPGTYGQVRAQQDLPNTCSCTTEEDNGMAIGWTVTVPANDSVTRSLLTFFSPVGTVPDQDPPKGLRIDVPGNGSVVNAAQPVFSGVGSAAPGDVRTAYLHIFKGTAVEGDPFAFQEIPIGSDGKWSAKLSVTPLPDGVYTAYFAQVDDDNNIGQSPAIAFAVDTHAPAPTVTAPSEGSTVALRPVLAGTAGNGPGDANAVAVELTGPGGIHREFPANNDGGRWVVQPLQDLPAGAWEVRVVQYDDAGNAGHSPTVHFAAAADGAQLIGELPPAGTPTTNRQVPAVTKSNSTRTRKKMPDLTGLRIDKARDALAKAGIHMDLNIAEEGGSSSKFRIGEVMVQNPKKGKMVVSDAEHRARISVKVFQGSAKKSCPAPEKLNKALKGMDLDVALRILKADGCKVELNMQSKGSGSSPEIGKVADGRGNAVTVTVNVPRRPSGQDLFLTVRTDATPSFKGLNVADWSLPLAQSRYNRLAVQVIDRAGRFVQNADVRFDLSQVDFRGDASLSTGRNGEAANPANPGVTIKADRQGVAKVLATATGSDGQTIYGYAQIRVKDPGANNEWETVNGLSFLGDTCRVGPRNSATSQGCVTNWLGSQTIPEELGRTTVSGIGPAVDPASESAFAALSPLIQDALSWDPAVVRMWQSSRLTNVNKMRNMVANANLYPAQLVIQGASPIGGNPVAGRQSSGTLRRMNGGREEHATGNQILATSGNVFAGVRAGLFSISGGQGRVFDSNGGRYTIDAHRSTVHTFDDGTSVLDDGTANPPWAAGSGGAIAIGQ